MKKENIILLLLALINFTQVMDFMIMMPLGDNLMTYFHTNAQGHGFIVSSYSISAGIFGLILAPFINNYDRKKVLLITYLGFVLGTLGCAFSTNIQMMIVLRIITGAFSVVPAALIFAIIGDLIPYEKRAAAMGMVMTGFSLAAAIGVPVGLTLGNNFGWQMPFYLISAIGLGVLLLLYFFLPSFTAHLDGNKSTYKQTFGGVFKNSNQVIALVFMCILMFSHFIIIPQYATYLEYNVGFNKEQLTWIYFLGGVISVITGPLFGKIGDKVGKHQMFMVLLLLTTIPVFLTTHLQNGDIALAFYTSAMFFAFGGSRISIAMTLVLSTATPKERAGFMSIRSSLQNLFAGLAAMVGGLIITQGPNGLKTYQHYDTLGYIAIGVSLITLLLVRKIKVAS